MKKNSIFQTELSKSYRGRQLVASIALILILAFPVIILALPTTNAHTPPWTVDTYAYIVVSPNPVGVGQTAYLTFWIDKCPPTAQGKWGMMWHNFVVTITKPDGETQILGPFDSDAVGGAWTQYVPDQLGTYKFDFEFPGQTVVDENTYPYGTTAQTWMGDIFTASSASTTLTVQQEQIVTAYPPNPVTTEYWERPLHSMNREWYYIAGNWLEQGRGSRRAGTFTLDSAAPNSAHVMWTEPVAFGGQIGGDRGAGDTQIFATGCAYEDKFSNVMAMYGILYYTEYPGTGQNPQGLKAINMHTGETVWENPEITSNVLCGMIYNFQTGNQYGGHAYVITSGGNKWQIIEAMTGDLILTIENVTTVATGGVVSNVHTIGSMGEILSYTVADGMLTMWNISKCMSEAEMKYYRGSGYSGWETFRPRTGDVIDWSPGNQWSVPIATEFAGEPLNLQITTFSDDVILLTQEAPASSAYSNAGWRVDVGYSAVDGSLLWGPINRTLTPWTNNFFLRAPAPSGHGVYTSLELQTHNLVGYSILTGEKLWGPVQIFNSSWNYYNLYNNGVFGYGNFYAWGMGGEVTCIDAATGEIKWTWFAGNSGIDTPFGVWPFWIGMGELVDGKLYLASGHSYTPPVFKGSKLYCINATTGELIWDTLHWSAVANSNPRPISDGYMASFSGYDNLIYCFGKGPSATTVAASPKISVWGSSVLIEGSVTDISPGTKESLLTARFPNGVAAISDKDQSAWMEYLYQQQPMPADAKGVEVVLETLDPNGNFYEIGKVTSDASGMYKLMWEPPVPGEYTIIATFEGSDSYYRSYAETAIGITEAASAGEQLEPEPSQTTETPYITTEAMIIIAIAIIAVLVLAGFYIFRRQK